jgi:hypothetical protein
MNEKEANHPAHPMDRTANWCSHGGWFTLAGIYLGYSEWGKANFEDDSPKQCSLSV